MLTALSLRWGKTKYWIRHNVSAREFSEWREEFKARPFGDEGVFQVSIAILASLVANVNRGRNTPPFKASQFLPYFKAPEVDLDAQILNGNW